MLLPGLWLGLKTTVAWDLAFLQQQIRKKGTQTKQQSCKSQLFHLSKVVPWQRVMTSHPKSPVILTRSNSWPFGILG